MTAVPKDRSHTVEADEDNVAFLGIHFDNSFADSLRDRLRKQCAHGLVTGIYTKYETFWYVLVERRKVTATGYCVDPQASRAVSRPEGEMGGHAVFGSTTVARHRGGAS